MARQEPYPVQAAATTFEIIETVRELEGAGVSELADHLSKPKSTVHDYLQTLTEANYLINQDGHYRVGARFLELGGHARSRMLVYQIAQPEVKKLARETGEHANLMIEEHGKGIFLCKSKGEEAVRLDTHAGMRVHLQTTALGKTILAHLPDDRVDEILDTHGLPEVTEETVTNRAELKDQLEEIRERGYAFDNEERVKGMRCVAAPITGPEDEVFGAISVSGPVSRMQGERFSTELPDMVTNAANVVEVNIAHSDQYRPSSV